MRNKVCTKCKEIKSVQHFFKDPRNRSGLKSWCKECFREYNLNYNKKVVHTKWWRIRNMYRHIIQRLKTPAYSGRKLHFSLEEFTNFIEESDFDTVFKLWKNNNYALSYTPTVDRVDNSGDYTLDNIQIISDGENALKDKIKGVRQLTTDGKLVNTYRSIREAGRANNISDSNICGCLKGRRYTLGGFKWEAIESIKLLREK
jgi:hypothetical protein